jgi:hypothetical protein
MYDTCPDARIPDDARGDWGGVGGDSATAHGENLADRPAQERRRGNAAVLLPEFDSAAADYYEEFWKRAESRQENRIQKTEIRK